MLVRPVMKRLFCLKAKNGLGRFAPSALPNYESYNNKSPRQCTTPCRKLTQQVFLFLPLRTIRGRFLFSHSMLVRLRRGHSRRHSSSSSSRSWQLEPHQCFECSRHGLLAVLLVLCITCSVAALLPVWCLELLECTCYAEAVLTIELSNSGVSALQALIILISCGAVALSPPERGYLYLWCLFRRPHCCCELWVAYHVLVPKATRTDVPVILPPPPFFLAIQA